MLLCSSKLPINEYLTPEILVELAIDWVMKSYNYKFDELVWDGSQEYTKLGQKGELFQVELFDEQNLCAIHFKYTDNRRVEWTTDYILDTENKVLAFQLYRDASSDAEYVPPHFDLPHLIQKVIDAGYFRSVHDINISDKPLFIYEDNAHIVKDLILRKCIYEIPVVYMSCITDGHCVVNPYTVAKKLKGVAIVLVETSRDVASLLRKETNGSNPYGGAIEVFYPKDQRRFVPGELIGTLSAKIATVTHSVFNHLLQTKIENKYSWSQLQSHKLRQQLVAAKSSAEKDSKDYDELEKMYEALLREKEQQISTLTGQLKSSNLSITQLEAQLSSVGEVPALIIGDEIDLFPNEQKLMLLEILQKALTSVPQNGRRQHVIQSILAANQCGEDLTLRREKLKSCLHGYTKMTPDKRRTLEELGFKITEDGKHYKLVFCEDSRYTGTLSKTGSDHRGGDNTAHDIIRKIF